MYDQKEPYTDEEAAAILDHASQLDGGTHGYAKHPETFRLLLELMLATGLRVGDAVALDSRALTKGDALWIYTYQPQKQKRSEKPKLLEAYITDEMKKKIDRSKWLKRGRTGRIAEARFNFRGHCIGASQRTSRASKKTSPLLRSATYFPHSPFVSWR